MIVKKFFIAGGNSTALVYDCPVESRVKTAKKLLKEVEQVGFVSREAPLPKLTMMGGELCLNATLAFASTLGKNGTLTTSGLHNPVLYSNKKDLTTIQIHFKIKQDKNLILMDGIGFILYDTKKKSEIKKSELSDLSKKYTLPAFGGIIYNKSKITPYVYVAGVDSFVRETACGSGSVAYSIFSGVKGVVQPTGKIISIKKAEFFDITAKVTSYD
ncbi:hypothetical protein ACFLT2_09105 [Acidobacteriota bacterium]